MDLKENMKTERGSWEQGISQSSKNLAEASKVSIYKVNNIKIKYSKLVHVSRCHRVFWILHNKTTLNHVKPLPWQFSQEWVWPSSWDSPWHWCWLPVLNLSPLASKAGSHQPLRCAMPLWGGEKKAQRQSRNRGFLSAHFSHAGVGDLLTTEPVKETKPIIWDLTRKMNQKADLLLRSQGFIQSTHTSFWHTESSQSQHLGQGQEHMDWSFILNLWVLISFTI